MLAFFSSRSIEVVDQARAASTRTQAVLLFEFPAKKDEQASGAHAEDASFKSVAHDQKRNA